MPMLGSSVSFVHLHYPTPAITQPEYVAAPVAAPVATPVTEDKGSALKDALARAEVAKAEATAEAAVRQLRLCFGPIHHAFPSS